MRVVSILCAAALLAAPAAVWAKGGSIAGKITAKKPKYLPNTVVFIDKAPGKFPAPKKPIEMGQKGNQFSDKIVIVLQGTTVRYLNSDPTEHSVYSPDGEKFDLGRWGQGESRSYKYEKLGTYTQLCKLHPMMLAYVVVVQNPYHAVTDDQGSFKIEGVPAGKYTLHVWNERRKADPVEVAVKGGAEATVSIALHR